MLYCDKNNLVSEYREGYVQVQEVKKLGKSFSEEFAKALMNFNLESSFEEQGYIDKTRELHMND